MPRTEHERQIRKLRLPPLTNEQAAALAVAFAEHVAVAGPCPACGGVRPLRIVYGFPSGELFDRHDIALGGCCIDEDGDPLWECDDCGEEWGDTRSAVTA